MLQRNEIPNIIQIYGKATIQGYTKKIMNTHDSPSNSK